MNPQWHYSPLVIPLSISLLLTVFLIALSIRERDSRLATPFLWFMIFVFIWIAASLLEISTLNLQLSLLFADLSFLGITFFPIAWIGTIMVYMDRGTQFRRYLPWLLIIPVMTNIIIWTNSFHHLWRGNSYRDLTTTWFPISEYEYGLWFSAVHLPYSLAIAFAATVLLAGSIHIRQQRYRLQIIGMLTAMNLPLMVELGHRFGIQPIPHFNSSVLAFPLTGLLLSWSLFRLNLLSITPTARDLVVENMADMMIVLDHQQRIVDLNPSARKYMAPVKSMLMGQTAAVFFAKQPQVLASIGHAETIAKEIEWQDPDGTTRNMELFVSPIIRRNARQSGWLLLLRDITLRKQAEQVLLKQAQHVAIQDERQRVARDLHDSVNQMLFAASAVANLIPIAIDQKPEKVPEYTLQLQNLLRGATAEMRLTLLELYPDALSKSNLNEIIKHLCNSYKGQTDTDVNFTANCEIRLEKDVQIVFYRIAQEALNNISKHTSATMVCLQLLQIDKTLEMVVQDNGPGFNLHDTPSSQFGLKNMRDRAQTVGADLHINSQPGQGTQIKLIWRPS